MMRPYDPQDTKPYVWQDICNACATVLEGANVPGRKVHGNCPACGQEYGVPDHEAI